MIPTPEMIDAFKAAWRKADEEARPGERVRDGLRAALAQLPSGYALTHLVPRIDGTFELWKVPNGHRAIISGIPEDALGLMGLTPPPPVLHPPEGCRAALDAEDRLWVRDGARHWCRPKFPSFTKSWTRLVDEHGPMRPLVPASEAISS